MDAAVANGVERYVFISIAGTLDLECALQSAKRAVERALRESGMTYTILRPSFFIEVWLSPALGFDVEQGTARIFGTGDQRMRWISLADVARFAVACIDHPAARNASAGMRSTDIARPVRRSTSRTSSLGDTASPPSSNTALRAAG